MDELLKVISSHLSKFIQADKFLLSKPLQHKFSKRVCLEQIALAI